MGGAMGRVTVAVLFAAVVVLAFTALSTAKEKQGVIIAPVNTLETEARALEYYEQGFGAICNDCELDEVQEYIWMVGELPVGIFAEFIYEDTEYPTKPILILKGTPESSGEYRIDLFARDKDDESLWGKFEYVLVVR